MNLPDGLPSLKVGAGVTWPGASVPARTMRLLVQHTARMAFVNVYLYEFTVIELKNVNAISRHVQMLANIRSTYAM